MELSCKFIYFNSPSSDITETNMANAISDARSYDRYSPSPPPLDSPVSDIPSEECLTTPMEEIERHLQSAPNKPNGESIVTPMSETEAPV
ncbi:hypothetical protein QFC19_004015 [Naganishia cerealis]|uniref:Uncharacterized protein n=1 Tax=Naganishia cerealis TaxID=610337 RepID=A0ACC2VXQ8_9TREE|nr:hypothetical protein QFC19_004015 [Naganishia cerealis]